MDEKLTFERFSTMNLKRCTAKNGFNQALESWGLSDWITAIAGELGEAANIVKKLNRHRDNIAGNKANETQVQLHEKLKRELIDTFIYLDLFMQRLGTTIDNELMKVFDAKSKQIGYEEKEKHEPELLTHGDGWSRYRYRGVVLFHSHHEDDTPFVCDNHFRLGRTMKEAMQKIDERLDNNKENDHDDSQVSIRH